MRVEPEAAAGDEDTDRLVQLAQLVDDVTSSGDILSKHVARALDEDLIDLVFPSWQTSVEGSRAVRRALLIHLVRAGLDPHGSLFAEIYALVRRLY